MGEGHPEQGFMFRFLSSSLALGFSETRLTEG